MRSKELGVSINRSAAETYDYLSAPENFSRLMWGSPLRRAQADWMVLTAQGEVAVRLSERNSFGVLDYSLRRSDGITAYVPLRVVANGSGCDLVLTLFRPDLENEKFSLLLAAKRVVEALDVTATAATFAN